MNSGQTVFRQLLQHLPRHEFNACVRRYRGEYWAKSFSTFDQFLCLAYAQLSGRESLRDIETCLNSHRDKLYHVGFRGADFPASSCAFIPFSPFHTVIPLLVTSPADASGR